MNRIGMAFLLAAAACFAVWIVLMRLQAPEPGSHAGWRRRFVLATLLFVAAWGAGTACRSCYAMDVSREAASDRSRDVVSTLRAVWLTLDPARGEELRKQIEPLVAQGRLQEPEGRMLAMAYAEIAFHRHRTRGSGSQVTCYDMTTLGGVLYQSRENALKQVELLREAARKGTIDAETAAKARAALARELEMLVLSGGRIMEVEKEDSWIREYQEKSARPSAPATSAAALIVGLEGGPMPDAGTPPGRP